VKDVVLSSLTSPWPTHLPFIFTGFLGVQTSSLDRRIENKKIQSFYIRIPESGLAFQCHHTSVTLTWLMLKNGFVVDYPLQSNVAVMQSDF
jgi:hypothetical protein